MARWSAGMCVHLNKHSHHDSHSVCAFFFRNPQPLHYTLKLPILNGHIRQYLTHDPTHFLQPSGSSRGLTALPGYFSLFACCSAVQPFPLQVLSVRQCHHLQMK